MVWMFYAAVLMALVYEGYAIYTTGTRTISAIVWGLSTRPLFPFVMGFLMGHFFWQR